MPKPANDADKAVIEDALDDALPPAEPEVEANFL